MCHECWKEFKGWCKAFTRTECCLAILEAFLLFCCIFFLIFLIMHMTVCQSWTPVPDAPPTPPDDGPAPPDDGPTPPDRPTTTARPHSTLDPSVKCTWEVSKKTEAETRYYEGDATSTRATFALRGGERAAAAAWETMQEEAAAGDAGSALLALVRPAAGGRGATFGCVLTAVTRRWALTAASCIEAVEEVASLDDFVIAEPGAAGAARHVGVADVQLHPLWQGANRTLDVAALRAAAALRPAAAPLLLPALPDHLLLTLGERATILGFGPFRSEEPTSELSAVRAVTVFVLPARQCRGGEGEGEAGEAEDEGSGEEGEDEGSGEGEERWAVRHLSRGRAEARAGGCGAGAVCAGVVRGRAAACGWCAGTPLVRAGRVLGVLAGPRACAAACPPAAYASIAHARDWLDMLLNPE